jgi:hypothetical protein
MRCVLLLLVGVAAVLALPRNPHVDDVQRSMCRYLTPNALLARFGMVNYTFAQLAASAGITPLVDGDASLCDATLSAAAMNGHMERYTVLSSNNSDLEALTAWAYTFCDDGIYMPNSAPFTQPKPANALIGPAQILAVLVPQIEQGGVFFASTPTVFNGYNQNFVFQFVYNAFQNVYNPVANITGWFNSSPLVVRKSRRVGEGVNGTCTAFEGDLQDWLDALGDEAAWYNDSFNGGDSGLSFSAADVPQPPAPLPQCSRTQPQPCAQFPQLDVINRFSYDYRVRDYVLMRSFDTLTAAFAPYADRPLRNPLDSDAAVLDAFDAYLATGPMFRGGDFEGCDAFLRQFAVNATMVSHEFELQQGRAAIGAYLHEFAAALPGRTIGEDVVWFVQLNNVIVYGWQLNQYSAPPHPRASTVPFITILSYGGADGWVFRGDQYDQGSLAWADGLVQGRRI